VSCSAEIETCRNQDEEKLGGYEVKIRDDEMRSLEVRVAYTWVPLATEKSQLGTVLAQVRRNA
jgi:hypothetical protein